MITYYITDPKGLSLKLMDIPNEQLFDFPPSSNIIEIEGIKYSKSTLDTIRDVTNSYGDEIGSFVKTWIFSPKNKPKQPLRSLTSTHYSAALSGFLFNALDENDYEHQENPFHNNNDPSSYY